MTTSTSDRDLHQATPTSPVKQPSSIDYPQSASSQHQPEPTPTVPKATPATTASATPSGVATPVTVQSTVAVATATTSAPVVTQPATTPAATGDKKLKITKKFQVTPVDETGLTKDSVTSVADDGRERSASTSRQTSVEPESMGVATSSTAVDTKPPPKPMTQDSVTGETPSVSGYTSQENTVTKSRARGAAHMNFEDLKQQLDQLRQRPQTDSKTVLTNGSQPSSLPTTPHTSVELPQSSSVEAVPNVSSHVAVTTVTSQTSVGPVSAHPMTPRLPQPYPSQAPSMTNVGLISVNSATSQPLQPTFAQPQQLGQTQPTSVLQTVPTAAMQSAAPSMPAPQALAQQLAQMQQSQQQQLHVRFMREQQQLQHQQHQQLQQYQQMLGQYQYAQQQAAAQQYMGQQALPNAVAAQLMQQAAAQQMAQQQMMAVNALSPRKLAEAQASLDAGLIPPSLVSTSGVMHPPQTLSFQPASQQSPQQMSNVPSSIPNTPPKSVIPTSLSSEGSAKPRRADRPPDLANLEQALIEKLHGNRKGHFHLAPTTPLSHYVHGQEMTTTPSHLVPHHVGFHQANTPVGVSPVMMPNSQHLTSASIRTPMTPAKPMPSGQIGLGNEHLIENSVAPGTAGVSSSLSDTTTNLTAPPLTTSSSMPSVSSASHAAQSGMVPATGSASAPTLHPHPHPAYPITSATPTTTTYAATAEQDHPSSQPPIAPATVTRQSKPSDDPTSIPNKSQATAQEKHVISKVQTRKGRFSVTVFKEATPPIEKPVQKENGETPKDEVDSSCTFVKPTEPAPKAAAAKKKATTTSRKGRFHVTTVKENVESAKSDQAGKPPAKPEPSVSTAPTPPESTRVPQASQSKLPGEVVPEVPQPAPFVPSVKVTTSHQQMVEETQTIYTNPAVHGLNVEAETQTTPPAALPGHDAYSTASTTITTSSSTASHDLPSGPQAAAAAAATTATNQAYSSLAPEANLNQVKSNNVSTLHPPSNTPHNPSVEPTSPLRGSMPLYSSLSYPNLFSYDHVSHIDRAQSISCLPSLNPAQPMDPPGQCRRNSTGQSQTPLHRQYSNPSMHVSSTSSLGPFNMHALKPSWTSFSCQSPVGSAVPCATDFVNNNPLLDFHHTKSAAMFPAHLYEVSR